MPFPYFVRQNQYGEVFTKEAPTSLHSSCDTPGYFMIEARVQSGSGKAELFRPCLFHRVPGTRDASASVYTPLV